MTATTATLASFLLARLAEDETTARAAAASLSDLDCWAAVGSDAISIRKYETGAHIARHDPARVLAEVDAKRKIVELHRNWPVLVEGPMEFDAGPVDDLNNMTMRMSRKMQWMTEQEYRVRFGTEPPTAPMLRALASVYRDHPEFREEWA